MRRAYRNRFAVGFTGANQRASFRGAAIWLVATGYAVVLKMPVHQLRREACDVPIIAI